MCLALPLLAAFLPLVVALTESLETGSSSIITLPYGSFQGKVDGTTAQFLGMPFAAPPTGERRFGFPKPPIPFSGIRKAVEFGAPCPQQNVTFSSDSPVKFPVPAKTMSEDCLFINVIRPANISIKKPLPVLFWFYGGGFEFGDTSLYPGHDLVNRSLALGEPVIYVSANYRLNAFGFLASKEVKERGLTNVGLRDQRFALQWVQRNIDAFGGDPSKVTIWGESAGAMSVGLHMIFDKGEHCDFSGAIMQSGSPMRLPDVLDQQVYFDNLASATNCTGAPDRFECLRDAPYPALQSAVDASPSFTSYQSLRLAWTPVIDGTLIPRNPMQLVESGKYARVPFITGVCEDEGTLFSFSSLNVTTNAQFVEYMRTNYFSYITDDEMQSLAAAYPDDITQGSPFGTGTANAITPQFKRIAAIQGDMEFQAPRRFFLEVASKTQPTYSYRYLKGASTPTIGAAHATEVIDFFGSGNQSDFMATDALIYFAHKHDPNPPVNSISLLRNTHWPEWSSSVENPPLLSFFDPAPLANITSDTYRSEAIKLMNQLLKQ